jgi:hypothetical protein
MPLFYATVTTAGRFADFPEPTRLGKNNTRSSKSKSSPSAYSTQICQQFGATDIAPTGQPARQAWQRPPVDIEYSLKDTTEFPALSSNKIANDTKSTASSTRLTVSEDFKSLIGKELAQFKEDAQTARFRAQSTQRRHVPNDERHYSSGIASYGRRNTSTIRRSFLDNIRIQSRYGCLPVQLPDIPRSTDRYYSTVVLSIARHARHYSEPQTSCTIQTGRV